MITIVNPFTTLYRKIKPLPYDKEVIKRLTPLREQLALHYYDPKAENIYLIRNFEDVNLVDTLGVMYEMFDYRDLYVYGTIKNDLIKWMKKYKYDFKGLVLVRKLSGTQEAYNLNKSEHEIDYLHTIYDNIRDVSCMHHSPLYKGYIAIKQLIHLLENIENNDMRLYIQSLLCNVDVADYIVKLERIGESPTVFNTLLKRDDAYLTSLFEPLHSIIEHIEVRRTTIEDEQLHQIIAWSSTKLLEVEALKEQKHNQYPVTFIPKNNV